MSRGSIRQKGNRWYYRFYVEDDYGRHIQKEFARGKSKRETETMLRHAIEEYEVKKFVASPGNITVGQLLDLWIEDILKSNSKSNGTLMLYQNTVNRIKKNPISQRKIKAINSSHLQDYLDSLYFKYKTNSQNSKPLAPSTIRAYRAVLQGAFKFAVFPKKLLSSNPMDYVVPRDNHIEPLFFQTESNEKIHTISHSQFDSLCYYLKGHPVLLPVQIAYYTGLRVGEICALTWEDVHLEEQYFLIQRTIFYNHATHHFEMDTPKGNKPRIVDFGNTLKTILEEAQIKKDESKGFKNFYHIVSDYRRKHYEIHSFPSNQSSHEDFYPIHFVCRKSNGTFLTPDYIGAKCRQASRNLDGFSGFHFHVLRHTYTSNLIQNGAAPKDVQELLGHSDINVTMNIYVHTNRENKRTSVKILDNLSVTHEIQGMF